MTRCCSGCATQLANVYRSLGEFDRAREIDSDVLSRQRAVLGLRHLRTLMTARSYGADLRLAGDFEAALHEDQSTWQAFEQTLGDDHLMTIIASGNLALSELLYGEPEQALQRLQDDVARAQRIRSERRSQEPALWSRIGTLQRQLGRYEKSQASLRKAWRRYEDLIGANEDIPSRPAGTPGIRQPGGHGAKAGPAENRETRGALWRTMRMRTGNLYPDGSASILSLAGDWTRWRRPVRRSEAGHRARAGCAEVLRRRAPIHPDMPGQLEYLRTRSWRGRRRTRGASRRWSL